MQAMIKGLTHFQRRNMTPRHFKVLMAVKLCLKTMKVPPRVEDIATFARLKPQDFRDELAELVELKYLHEVVPQFGDLVMTYKLGSRGGSLVSHLLERKDKCEGKKEAG